MNITLVVKDVIELLILRGGAYAESSGWALNANSYASLEKRGRGVLTQKGRRRCDHGSRDRVMQPKTNTNDQILP